MVFSLSVATFLDNELSPSLEQQQQPRQRQKNKSAVVERPHSINVKVFTCAPLTTILAFFQFNLSR